MKKFNIKYEGINMKNEKIQNITVFLTIILYFASNILIRNVSNLDELWNYNFANNIANGLIPYRDFNMVTTPLLPIICGIILKIFGQELIVMRIINIILNSSIVFLTYKIMETLQIKKYLIYILLIALCYTLKDYIMMDYNFVSALITLIIVYLEIKNYKNEKVKYQIIIGILAGICITIKQTTGLAIALALVGYKILDIRNKQELKQYLKMAIWKIAGILIPVLCMIIYLVINNAFYDFIDYCILGVTTFSNKISYISRLIQNEETLIKIFSIMPIFLLVLLLVYIVKRDSNSLILFSFGITSLIVVYPISDEVHMLAGIYITLIGFAYILNKLIKLIGQYKCFREDKKTKIFAVIERALCTGIATFTILFTIYQAIDSTNIYINSNKNYELKHYKGGILEQDSIDSVVEVDNFIKNCDKKVYILDATAAYYMIPINRYNKNYDMFNLGNLGSKGEEGQIENLQKELGNIVVLIKNEKYSRNWQNPENVRKWIIQSMEKTGEIGIFDIYMEK